ncbi:hard surface-induced protein [Niveomyces insectorum RCEF 264]|uniref:Hard surface-induced protein n=1 Tax=Niveomyces insectorum RCEF 264 TaxID=1081102 RepID=A0A167YP26_9HYPO|nr:hard surface-induced protein [Niveomyces insectorum RCEF 264]
MAFAAFRGLRRWVPRHAQPLYEQLTADETVEDELKHEADVENGFLSNGDSSSSSSSEGSGTNSPRNSDGFRFGHDHDHDHDHGHAYSGTLRGLPATVASAPALMLRLVWLCLLLATEPIRRHGRRLTAAWPTTYLALEEFKALVPSFLKPSDGKPPRRLHPTAWLDGLRGVAAFLVVWHHASLLWFPASVHWGYHAEKTNNLFIQLPIVRLLISGPPQVAIFFVVSGYALSYKPLRLARLGRYAEAGEAIHSSVFRRHTRLFLMPVVVSFVAVFLTYFDLYGSGGWTGVAAAVRRPPKAPTFAGQLLNWIRNVMTLVSPLSKDLNRGRTFGYDPNLWTLPVEFDCSLMLFLCQAAFVRLRPRVRMLLMLGLVCYAQMYIYWQAFLFLAGMLVCDLHFHLDGTGSGSRQAPTASASSEMLQMPTTTAAAAETAAHAPENLPPPEFLRHHDGVLVPPSNTAVPTPTATFNRFSLHQRTRTFLGVLGFLVGLYLLSTPEKNYGGISTPGFQTLQSWVSSYYRERGQIDYFWVPLGGAWLVLCVDRTPLLQRLFTGAFPQYLGSISYSLYLVHGPLIWTIGHWLVRQTTALSGTATTGQYGLGIVLSALLLWPVLITVADLATRTLDVRAVQLGRTLYERFSENNDSGPSLPRVAP